MSYYSGTAATLGGLRTALLGHAQTDGWVLTGDVLSKAGVYFQIGITGVVIGEVFFERNITCLGCESDVVANPAPHVVMMGRIFFRSGYPTREITFPCNYEVFGFAQELYLVANYDVDSYQWMAFGKTSVPGIPGQGGWCGASIGSGIAGSNAADAVNIYATDGGGWCGCPALFYSISAATTTAWNYHVNSGLDGHGWSHVNSATPSYNVMGINNVAPIYGMQPSAWNSETTLLPMRCYKERGSYKTSLSADLDNARHLRIDNLAPADILTIGSDKWKVFPWYRKDSSARNGGADINHTGTFGWAIRYEGP